MDISESRYSVNTPNYKFEKKDFGVIKSLLKLIKKYGFERDGDVYKVEEYLIKIYQDDIVFQKISSSEPMLVTVGNAMISLSSVFQISSYDISYYLNDDILMDKNIFIKRILFSLKEDLDTELKWIVRKNKIKKLL